MKFGDMPYVRPDYEAAKKLVEQQTQALQNAASFEEADAAFLEIEKFTTYKNTLFSIAYIRQNTDTSDAFYDAEVRYLTQNEPILEESMQDFNKALLQSPFRDRFESKYNSVFFANMEKQAKAFSPEIVPLLQQESQLRIEYTNLLASAQIELDGSTYTIAQMTPLKQDRDDKKRRAAWEAEGRWYVQNGEKLDEIYDKLVALRTEIGKKLGYDSFVPVGYLRMQRNGYDKTDVEKFRQAVVKHLVPVASEVVQQQAKRLGVSYPLTFDQEALFFVSGNARPIGTPDEILETGRKFYHELSPETAEFIDVMLDNDLMDVAAKKGKAGGGYCDSLAYYKVPFIFANFNGTQGDVEVITHEAGHAFAGYVARDVVPAQSQWPSMESCEIHSMSMEFFAWPWAESFFGDEADKFRYKHLSSALTFIPYGTMVDHFQHIMYENPQYSPAQRHDVWRELIGTYMPWMKMDDLPFYGEGKGWQRQLHIYRSPFYYIDYCLAQSVALQFFAVMQEDPSDAWARYMDLVNLAGTCTFKELVATAKLQTPFGDGALKTIAASAKAWLDAFDADKLA